jgi:hypothetical protein
LPPKPRARAASLGSVGGGLAVCDWALCAWNGRFGPHNWSSEAHAIGIKGLARCQGTTMMFDRHQMMCYFGYCRWGPELYQALDDII